MCRTIRERDRTNEIVVWKTRGGYGLSEYVCQYIENDDSKNSA